MSGALAERVFAEKLERAGFVEVWMGGHQPFAIDDAARYPLFTPEVIEVMRRAISARPPGPRGHGCDREGAEARGVDVGYSSDSSAAITPKPAAMPTNCNIDIRRSVALCSSGIKSEPAM